MPTTRTSRGRPSRPIGRCPSARAELGAGRGWSSRAARRRRLALLGSARRAEAHDLVRPVAEGTHARLAAATQGDGLAPDLDLVAVLVHEPERPADQQGAVAVRGERRLVHWADATPGTGSTLHRPG